MINGKNAYIVDVNNKKYFVVDDEIDDAKGVFICNVKDENGKFLCAKVCATHNQSSPKLKRFKKEIDYSLSHNHKYVLHALAEGKFHVGKKQPMNAYIMEKYDCDFRAIIKQRDKYSIEQRLKWAAQIATGINTIHNDKVIHRDIKPENILYDSKKDKIRICDLGIAHFSDLSITGKEDNMANFNYYAPEQAIDRKDSGTEITKKCDWYAFGLILNELFTGFIPKGNNYKKVEDEHPYLWFIDFEIEKLLQENPNKRPNNGVGIMKKINHTFDEFKEIRDGIERDLIEKQQGKQIDSCVFKEASNDLTKVFYVLQHNPERIYRLNGQYHQSIKYLIKENYLDSAFYLEILKLTRRQFDYENAKDINDYCSRRLPDVIKLSNMIANLKVWKIFKKYNSEIIKKYLALRDYHGDDLLGKIREARLKYVLGEKRKLCEVIDALENIIFNKDLFSIEDLNFGDALTLVSDSVIDDSDDPMFLKDYKEEQIEKNIELIENKLQELVSNDISFSHSYDKHTIYFEKPLDSKKFNDLCESYILGLSIEATNNHILDVRDCEAKNESDVELDDFYFFSILGRRILQLSTITIIV